jgi:chemotaxis protein MotB
MKIRTPSALILSISLGLVLNGHAAHAQDAGSVRHGEAAVIFASGSIQKATPRDGVVNLITGDNQSSGNRMLLGTRDTLYLKLNNPADAAVGDLYTVYRRVRKVLHPLTREYLGLVTIRLAVVKVTDIGHALTTVETVVGYGPILPGDHVARFVPPAVNEETGQRTPAGHLEGMIVELQADRPMTMVSQSNVVYVDRGSVDGLRAGDVLDLHRHSTGLPERKIGQLKILSTEERTATARVIKANTRVFKGDRFRLAGHSEAGVQPVETMPPSARREQEVSVPADLVADRLRAQEASGQSRINLGDIANFLRYESGEAAIRPEGYKVLDQLIEHLRSSGDTRLIRVEGHTDNVEIGPSLKSRYPSNADLSKARAASVVRYLIEKGGVDSAKLSSVGYGDSRPAGTNANEEGRSKNRRVEIVLYGPDVEPSTSTSNDAGRQKQEGDPSALKAGDTVRRPAAPSGDSAGTLSVSEQPPQTAFGEGSATANSPDSRSMMPPAGDQLPQTSAADGTAASVNPSVNTPSQDGGKQIDTSSGMGSPGL